MPKALYHKIIHPENSHPNNPMLVLMHGIGSNEEDLLSLANDIPNEFRIISLRGPLSFSPSQFAWYELRQEMGKTIINVEQQEKSLDAIHSSILNFQKEYNTSAKYTFVGGFSQGAVMTYSYTIEHPTHIGGFLAFSGRLLDESKKKFETPDSLKKINALISHGTKDKVISVENAKMAKAFFEDKLKSLLYKEYQIDHRISEAMAKDMNTWLKNRIES
ncbi:putative carboxylesterase 2 [Leptospira ryugenii]|uniref:Putative carboxylesterase 2 n=1 Tax=Leptospira ryugenii TaxID=1917863 RepID=A0A2P2E346_9LEPT|nr:esterase [Leptospira ryugenii]GBF51297.1 putative carboxylesterase 2 [Leptospira ryugenii]